MFRSIALISSLLTGALALSAVSACSVHGEAKFGSDATKPPPPPPPTEDPKADNPSTPGTNPNPDAGTGSDATDPDKPKPPSAKLKGGQVEPTGRVSFDAGSTNLSAAPENETALGSIASFLSDNKEVTELRIEGHTSNVGQDADNIELSGQRALAVKRWLAAHGIAEARLIAAGCGSAKPVANNNTDEGRAKNERTEFKLATVRGKRWNALDPTGGCKVFE